jgi:A/G-specific adenine glycosylase
MNKRDFQELIWQKASELYRDMPWRQNTDPYYVLVSELMLQQTQVDRVIPKFEAFIAAFPTVAALAQAPLSEVLQLWSTIDAQSSSMLLHKRL